jgi:hypothetical protein
VIVRNTMIPLVSITGAAIRTTHRSKVLSMGSLYSVESCGSANVSATTLDFRWEVYKNNILDSTQVNTAKDITTLMLGAYSLAVNTYYTMKLTVSIEESRKASSAIATVFVAQGEIKAIIAGPKQVNMRLGGDSITLDASSSFDEDEEDGIPPGGMTYTWSCIQTAPSFNSNCLVNIGSSSADIEVSTLSDSVDTSSEVSVIVSDGSRQSKTSVVVMVLPELSAVVSVVSNLPPTLTMNPSKALHLKGNIILPAGSNGTAEWLVENDGIDLAQGAQSALKQSLEGQTKSFFLVLAPNFLAPGLSLTFKLTCRIPNQATIFSSSITILVNAPPIPGKFEVTPSSGTELVDEFLFFAAQWGDVNLPLKYIFGYRSLVGRYEQLRGKAETSYGSLLLPAGDDSKGNNVTCIMQVFDSLNAYSSATSVVRVIPGREMSLSDIAEYSDDNAVDLEKPGQVNNIRQSLALTAYLINRVNCSGAPVCGDLSREGCTDTINTCGSCLNGFRGDYAPSNGPCVNPSSSTSTEMPLKTCITNCTGHGSCMFVSVDNTEIEFEECRSGDPQCKAVCVCEDDYAGTKSCSIANADLVTKQQLRAASLKNLDYLVANENTNAEAVLGWVTTLDASTQDMDELSDASLLDVFDKVNMFTKSASETELSNEVALSML